MLRRPPRLSAPAVESGVLPLAQLPADLGRGSRSGTLQMIMPVLGSAGGLVMMLANPSPAAAAEPAA